MLKQRTLGMIGTLFGLTLIVGSVPTIADAKTKAPKTVKVTKRVVHFTGTKGALLKTPAGKQVAGGQASKNQYTTFEVSKRTKKSVKGQTYYYAKSLDTLKTIKGWVPKSAIANGGYVTFSNMPGRFMYTSKVSKKVSRVISDRHGVKQTIDRATLYHMSPKTNPTQFGDKAKTVVVFHLTAKAGNHHSAIVFNNANRKKLTLKTTNGIHMRLPKTGVSQQTIIEGATISFSESFFSKKSVKLSSFNGAELKWANQYTNSRTLKTRNVVNDVTLYF